MSTTDIVLLGVIGVGMLLGAKDGFIHTMGRLIGAVVGFMLAFDWSSWLAGTLAIVMPAGWARVIAFLAVFAVIIRLMGFALKLVDKVFKIMSFVPFLKPIDRLLGAIIGLGEAIILVGGVMYLVTTFKPVPSLYVLLTGSGVARWIDGVFRNLLGLLLK